MTLIFIGLGLLFLLAPLRWLNSIVNEPGSPPSYPILIVPIVGGVLLAIGILAYHKSDIQCIFYKACRDIDKSGLGMGIGQAGISFYNSLFGTQSNPPSQINDVSAPSQSQVSNIKPLSQIQ